LTSFFEGAPPVSLPSLRKKKKDVSASSRKRGGARSVGKELFHHEGSSTAHNPHGELRRGSTKKGTGKKKLPRALREKNSSSFTGGGKGNPRCLGGGGPRKRHSRRSSFTVSMRKKPGVLPGRSWRSLGNETNSRKNFRSQPDSDYLLCAGKKKKKDPCCAAREKKEDKPDGRPWGSLVLIPKVKIRLRGSRRRERQRVGQGDKSRTHRPAHGVSPALGRKRRPTDHAADVQGGGGRARAVQGKEQKKTPRRKNLVRLGETYGSSGRENGQNSWIQREAFPTVQKEKKKRCGVTRPLEAGTEKWYITVLDDAEERWRKGE